MKRILLKKKKYGELNQNILTKAIPFEFVVMICLITRALETEETSILRTILNNLIY